VGPVEFVGLTTGFGFEGVVVGSVAGTEGFNLSFAVPVVDVGIGTTMGGGVESSA
jgi:hypothetical protein